MYLHTTIQSFTKVHCSSNDPLPNFEPEVTTYNKIVLFLGLPLRDGLPHTRVKKQLVLSPPRHASPLHSKPSQVAASDSLLPVAPEVEQEMGVQGLTLSSSGHEATSSVADAQHMSGGQSQMSCDQNQVSCDHPDDSIPSAHCIDSSQHGLPPVPNRLVPSRSTERIMELLNQHDRKREATGSLVEERKQTPLSSTPAFNRARSQNSSQVSTPWGQGWGGAPSLILHFLHHTGFGSALCGFSNVHSRWHISW